MIEEIPTTSGTATIAVPNFREDERVLARYDAMLARRIKDFYAEHDNAIRRNAAAKNDALNAELAAAQADYEDRKQLADETRASYGAAFPQHVKKMRLEEPSLFENVRSRGAAQKLFAAAADAQRAYEHAAGDVRRLELNETQLDGELQKALERAPQLSKEVVESAKWLAEIHAEEELCSIKAKVDAIVAERDAYGLRLAAGNVSGDELRLRGFAEANIKPMLVPIEGVMFARLEHYGAQTYFVLRDLRKQCYALPYDRRLETLLNGVYDIVRTGKEFALRRSLRADGRTPVALLEHFTRCHDNDGVAAQEAYRTHQQFVKDKRAIVAACECNETEARAIELFAAFAYAQLN